MKSHVVVDFLHVYGCQAVNAALLPDSSQRWDSLSMRFIEAGIFKLTLSMIHARTLGACSIGTNHCRQQEHV